MNYTTLEVTKYVNCPDEWSQDEIEDFIAKTKGLNASDTCYMAGDAIPLLKEEFWPVMLANRQFLKLKKMKENLPDRLLLFRCGNFYEAYGDDAETLASVLGLTVIYDKSIIGEDGKPVSRTAFPHHAIDTYLPKVIRAGHPLVIADRYELN